MNSAIRSASEGVANFGKVIKVLALITDTIHINILFSVKRTDTVILLREATWHKKRRRYPLRRQRNCVGSAGLPLVTGSVQESFGPRGPAEITRFPLKNSFFFYVRTGMTFPGNWQVKTRSGHVSELFKDAGITGKGSRMETTARIVRFSKGSWRSVSVRVTAT